MRPSEKILEKVRSKIDQLHDWFERLKPEHQKIVETSEDTVRKIALYCYLDGYYRIRQTTPLMLAASRAFNWRKQYRLADIWSKLVSEELGHDQVLFKDLINSFGSETSLLEALAKTPMAPPTASILGYLHWQITEGDPQLLMIYKLFLEEYASSQTEAQADVMELLGEAGTRCLKMHQELDENHVKDCNEYVDEHFDSENIDAAIWTADFIGNALLESQLWIASRILSSLEANES
mgnify:CR=1 FL=1